MLGGAVRGGERELEIREIRKLKEMPE